MLKERKIKIMNKKKIIVISTIISVILIITISIIIIINKINKQENIEESKVDNIKISEEIKDECTNEYEESQNLKPVSATKEKISANSQLILKKYYMSCDHTINEYVEMPQELVNLTKEEVQAKYPDWKVIGFSPEKVILYKEFNDECDEHFKLKVEEGKISVYKIEKDGTQTLYEKTDISSEYLTETDLINMQDDGLEIYGIEELNKIIEDFE